MDGTLRNLDLALNVLAVVQNEKNSQSLRMVLENYCAEVALHVGNLAHFAPKLRSNEAPDILIAEVSLGNPDEVDLLSEVIAARRGRTVVIATAADADLAGIRSLMRIGVADFLPQPISKADLVAAIESASNALKTNGRRQRSAGSVVSVIHSSGGAGGTTLSVQAAMELTGRGKEKNSVSLIDLDLQFGTVGLSLDMPDNGGLPLILEAPSRLDKALLRASMVEHHKSGVSVLAAPSTIVPMTVLKSDTVNRILSLARTEFDYVICDLPHAWTNWTAGVLRATDQIVLVTEISVPALQRTRRVLDLIGEQGLGEIPVTVVANKVETGWGFGKRRQQAEEALGVKFDFIIRNDPATALAAHDRGVPLNEIKGSSVIVKDVRDMVGELKRTLTRVGNDSIAKPV